MISVFSRHFRACTKSASRASVLTLAIFAPEGATKMLVGEPPPNPANFGTKCPEAAALYALCLRPGAIAPSLSLWDNLSQSEKAGGAAKTTPPIR